MRAEPSVVSDDVNRRAGRSYASPPTTPGKSLLRLTEGLWHFPSNRLFSDREGLTPGPLWVNSGWPRQLRLMYEKSRCSIVFHLLVPGGKWQVVMVRPVRLASCCSSHFQSRSRAPLLPPASAVMSSERARR
jgi:hypothetical protein